MSAIAENKDGKSLWALDVYPDGYEIYYGSVNNYEPPKPKLVTLRNGNLAKIKTNYNGFTMYEYPPDQLPSNRTLAKFVIKLGLIPYRETYHPFGSPAVELTDDIIVYPDILDPPKNTGSWWPT